MTTVAVLHPGEMGAAVGRELVGGGARVVWCAEGRSARTRRRAVDAGLVAVEGGLAGVVAEADVVVSMCPPAYAVQVAEAVAGCGFAGVFVEANAVGPRTVRGVAERVEAAGARVVDGCLIGSPPDERTRTRLYLAGGDGAGELVAGLFAGTRVDVVVLDQAVGAASALKMAFGSFQKGARVIAAVSHALAAEYGVTDELVVEGGRGAAGMLADTAFLSTAAAHAWRWGPEMEEAAATLADAGLPPDLALAAAQVMGLWRDDKDVRLPLAEVLGRLRVDRADTG